MIGISYGTVYDHRFGAGGGCLRGTYATSLEF